MQIFSLIPNMVLPLPNMASVLQIGPPWKIVRIPPLDADCPTDSESGTFIA